LREFLEGLRADVPFYGGAGFVGKYFYNALNALWGHITPALTNPAYKDYEVYFTGHSLGGALTSMAAMRAVMEGYRTSERIFLYTFGEPRQGNRMYAFRHDELVPNSYRVVNQIDIVPHLPPCAPDMLSPERGQTVLDKPCLASPPEHAFYHHGLEVWYENGLDMSKLPSPTSTTEIQQPQPQYKICTGKPRNEDFKCSDSRHFAPGNIQTINDHIKYFDHYLVPMAKFDCVSLLLNMLEPGAPLMPAGGAGGVGTAARDGGMLAKLADKAKLWTMEAEAGGPLVPRPAGGAI